MEAAVVGAGTMGAGIAQLLVQNAVPVRLIDVSAPVLSKAQESIAAGLQKAGKPEALSLVRTSLRLEDAAGAAIAIEAAAERLDVKQELFRELAAIDGGMILATNTSSLSVAQIASGVARPERVMGLHFFNPAPLMRLVEVVKAEKTSAEAVRFGVELVQKLGKTAVVCKDTPGFIANRVARPFYLTGMRLLERGAGLPSEIDAAVRSKGGFKMGPFELMDLIGLEVNLAISTAIYEALGKPERLKPCEVQQRLVARGDLGRKSGKGFYVYGGAPGVVNPAVKEAVPSLASAPLPAERVFGEILDLVVEEARRVAIEGVASGEDIDKAMTLGLNWPKGPLQWEKQLSRRS